MKINAHLTRSRHGVYYYRAIIPINMRTQLGFNEVKRSLSTKDPKKAKCLAQYISLMLKLYSFDYLNMLISKDSNFLRLENMANSFPNIDFRNISKWTVKDDLNGLTFKADPSIPGDEEGLRTLILKLQEQRLKQEASDLNTNKSGADVSSVNNAEQAVCYMNDLIPSWKKHVVLTIDNQKTIDEYASKLKVFATFIGKTPVIKITKKQVSDFLMGLSIGEITGKKLSKATINKYLCAINSFFNQAQREGIWPDNQLFPTHNQRLKKQKSDKLNNYKPFTTQDLISIFDASNVLDWKCFNGQMHEPHMTWLPLLGLFTGARIEELCQLGLDNIYKDISTDESGKEHSVWVIDINDEDGRHLKTNAAIRKIPLHPQLITLGFLDYIADIRQNFPQVKNLFPYLSPNKYGKLGDSAGKWYGRYLEKIDIKDSCKVFHSFRSTANNILKIAGINEETRCQMVGHEHNSINSKHYTNQHNPKWLLDNVTPKLLYPQINFKLLRYKKGNYVEVLNKLLEINNSKSKNLSIRKQKSK